MPAKRPGQVRTGLSTTRILEGTDNVRDWTDEELLHGRRAAHDGSFRGAVPKVIPMAVVEERNRRLTKSAYQKYIERIEAAVDYLNDVIEGKVPNDKGRAHACHMLLNRAWGREPQIVQLAIEDKPIQALLGQVYTSRSMAELEEDNDTAAELKRLNEEALRRARSIETASTEETSPAEDLEPQEERSGLLRRKRKVVHRPANSAEDQRAHIRNARSTRG